MFACKAAMPATRHTPPMHAQLSEGWTHATHPTAPYLPRIQGSRSCAAMPPH